MHTLKNLALALGLICALPVPLGADQDVRLLDMPDYNWHAGCFGTATGNLMGYWDRHGFPDIYTGPTAGGIAPLNDAGANVGIRSMWASQAGFDGRPANKMGHINDYWIGYENTDADPHVTAGRQEHAPDCVGDFIGLNQKKWTNMNSECDGNIDGYSFVYWDTRGNKRINYTPSTAAGSPARDIQSGLRAWAQYRGYDADVFTQLADINPRTPSGQGFSFEALKAEINAGYPVLMFLQDYNVMSLPRSGMPRANPNIHGMLAYGYVEYPGSNTKWVHCRTSWASGDWPPESCPWNTTPWVSWVNLSLRGVIGFHPKPKIRSVTRSGGNATLIWDGPSSRSYDEFSGVTTTCHRYQVQRSSTLNPAAWQAVGSITTERTLTVPDSGEDTVFYRIRLLHPGENP